MARHPDFMIFANGADVTAGLLAYKVSMTVTDNAGSEADTLEIVLSDKDGMIAIPEKGTVLEVFFGYRGDSFRAMGKFVVDDVNSSGGDQGMTLTITAKAANMGKAQKEKRTRNYHDKTLKQVLSAEAGEHGLALQISPELGSIKLDFLAKTDQSMLSFGTQLASRYDAVFKIAGSTMIFAKRQQGKRLTGGKLPVIAILRGVNLLSWDVHPRKVRSQYGSVRASWYDPDKAKTLVEKTAGGDGPVLNIGGLHQNAAEAKAATASKKGEMDRGSGGGSFVIDGNPLAMAESVAVAVGTRPGVDGRWFVKTAVHAIGGDQPYITTLTVEPETGKKK